MKASFHLKSKIYRKTSEVQRSGYAIQGKGMDVAKEKDDQSKRLSLTRRQRKNDVSVAFIPIDNEGKGGV